MTENGKKSPPLSMDGQQIGQTEPRRSLASTAAASFRLPLLESSPQRRLGGRPTQKTALHFLPGHVKVDFFSKTPGFQKTVSNLSDSPTGDNGVDVLLAYECHNHPRLTAEPVEPFRCSLDQDAQSTHSKMSLISLETKDTFSTSPAVGVTGAKHNRRSVGGGRICPASVERVFHWRSKWAESIVKSRTFKRFSILLILLHCVIAAIATSDWVTENYRKYEQFENLKAAIVWIMTCELVFQFLANGVMFFYDAWLVFDLTVVGFSWIFQNLLVIRTFRVVRTLRLASWIKDLKQLVRALLMVIPKMFAIFFLLLILFFVFAILFVDLFKHSYVKGVTSADYFGSLEAALFTLFQIMTLDNWAIICKELMTESPWAWAPFIAFVIVSSFFFLNLVIAVVCEAVTSVHRETVVKSLREDISAATSVRDTVQVDDRLDEMSTSVQLLMQSQITLLEAIQSRQENASLLSPSTARIQNQIEEDKAALRQEMSTSFFGKTPLTATEKELGSEKSNTSGLPRNNLLRGNPLHNEHEEEFQEVATYFSRPYWENLGMTTYQIGKVLSAMETARRNNLTFSNP